MITGSTHPTCTVVVLLLLLYDCTTALEKTFPAVQPRTTIVVLYLCDVHVPITDARPPSLTSRLQDIFRRLTNPTLKKLYRFVLKRLVGRFLDDDIALEVSIVIFLLNVALSTMYSDYLILYCGYVAYDSYKGNCPSRDQLRGKDAHIPEICTYSVLYSTLSHSRAQFLHIQRSS